MKSDESWGVLPVGLLGRDAYGIAIRQNNGAFRQPTKLEIDDLLTCQKRASELAAGLANALGMLRYFATVVEPALPEEATIAQEKMKQLLEILSRSGYLT